MQYFLSQEWCLCFFEENVKGDIAVGKAADFVLLSDNLLDIDVDKIKDVKVLNTS